MPACDVCLKSFKQKSHLAKHKERKRPCVKDTTLETLVAQKVQEALQNVIVANAVVPTTITKPLLKWVGGKTQILDSVLSRFPPVIRHYYEPFLGGGSVLLGLLGLLSSGKIKVTGTVYASDVNKNLIAFYRNVQGVDTLEPLLAELKTLCAEYDGLTGKTVNRAPTNLEEAKTSQESYYYYVRGQYNGLTGETKYGVRASAMLLFLNKTGFRGVYREGPHGYNVPFGHYTNPTVYDETEVRRVSALIRNVVFRDMSWSVALSDLGTEDFVYLDPPYAPETDTSFVGYTAGGFGPDDHTALFARIAALKTAGVPFLMSNADVKLVRDAFPSPTYTTIGITARRAINSKNPESVTKEVLIQ